MGGDMKGAKPPAGPPLAIYLRCSATSRIEIKTSSRRKTKKVKATAKYNRKNMCPKMQRVGFDFGNNCDIKGAKPPAGPPPWQFNLDARQPQGFRSLSPKKPPT